MDCISINADGSNHDVRLQRPPSPVHLKMKKIIPNIITRASKEKVDYLFWTKKDHKIRETVFKFQDGSRLDAVAHLKRFLGAPSHWKFEFRFCGTLGNLTLQEYTNVRMALDLKFNTDIGFEFVRGWEKVALVFIIGNLEKLKGRFVEYTHTLTPFKGPNPYEYDYIKISEKYRRRSHRTSVRILD